MNLVQLAAELAALGPRIEAAEQQALEQCGAHLQHAAQALIGQELAVWPPLADSTIAEKQALGFTGQVSATDPLLRTGELRDSIQYSASGHTRGDVGSDLDVAEWQQHGASRGLPPRLLLGTALEQETEACGAIIASAVSRTLSGDATSTSRSD